MGAQNLLITEVRRSQLLMSYLSCTPPKLYAECTRQKDVHGTKKAGKTSKINGRTTPSFVHQNNHIDDDDDDYSDLLPRGRVITRQSGFPPCYTTVTCGFFLQVDGHSETVVWCRVNQSSGLYLRGCLSGFK